jgi:sterol desaturase/sphingolipid hydroxylase (fatty acid hydroxylase superfamily)
MEFPGYILAGFVVLVLIEVACLYRTGRSFSINIAVSNISCGVVALCTKVFYGAAFALLYSALESRFGLTQSIGWQWWSLAFTFVLVDLCYYAYHRMSHRVALLWGAHIVHHESDEYNLTVSLRQSSVGVWMATPFYLLPALIGVPLPVFIVMSSLYQLYQFFVHTALVENMGWLERVISTPRLHRLHHARNDEYLDCNYSGFLLVWDKLFGSYRAPSVKPVFGITEPIRSWSPLWANLGYFHELYLKVRTRQGWDRLYTLIRPPDWHPATESNDEKGPYVSYASQPRPGLVGLALAVFFISMFLAIGLAAQADRWDTLTKTSVVCLATASALLATRLYDGNFSGAPGPIIGWARAFRRGVSEKKPRTPRPII